MAGLLTRLLLLVVCAFAALSSSAATALGFAEERILLFTGLVTALLLLPFLVRPSLARPSGPLVVVCALLAWIVLSNAAGSLDPVDAKVALPVLVLLAAPNLAKEFTAEEVMRLVWWLLATYIAVTFAYQFLAEPAAVARGYEGIVRYDPTGSVVMHSSLSLIFLVLAAARLGQNPRLTARAGTAALAVMALAMLLLTATRTALLTGALLGLLVVLTSPDRGVALRRLALAALGFGLAFLAWTLLVSDSFFLRLTGGQEDYSSGRWSSIGHWLTLAGEHPFGMGLGTVRRLLADGRPALDGTALLEWPHNEPVRFYVEAGPPGLLFVVLLLALLVGRAVCAARHEADPQHRTLMLAIAADLVAEALLQNLFNAVYHATVLILVLSLAVATSSGSAAGSFKGARGAPALHPCPPTPETA
jgi:O-antigen ligase